MFPALGNMKLSAIKPVHLNSLYNSLRKDGVRQDGKDGGYSDTTINMIHVTISSILKKAVEWDVIMSNPCDRVKMPRRAKDSDDIEYFTVEQAQAFLAALDMEYDQPVKARKRKDRNGNEYTVAAYVNKVTVPLQFKVLFNVAIYGGLRRGEIVSLKWSDIDFVNSTIKITKLTAYAERETFMKGTKTKLSNREITMPSSVMKLLKEYRAEYLKRQMQLGSKWAMDDDGNRLDFLFTQWNGKQMNLSTPLKRFHSVINQYNATVQREEDKLPLIRFHGLRHPYVKPTTKNIIL
ncbi:MAG: tyrosine-type recombinase/integrase [Eubacterium sp.]|nr:tyrosine-type recombinase/integrase [Eubacterium sp.]